MIYDVLIIGAGPAGLNAAIYASRAGLKVGIIEKDVPGGKMVKTDKIENYLGNVVINGADLSMSMFNHATSFGAEYLYGDVKKVSKINDVFELDCVDEKFVGKSVIIATGTKERQIGIPGEVEFYGRGVSYCAICDGGLYKGKDVVVIGGGNSALQESLYLSKIVNKVYLVHRRNEFRGEDYLVEKIKLQSNIELVLSSVPTKIKGEKKVNEVVVQNVETLETKTLLVDAVFPFIGFDPVTDFIDKELLDEKGYLITNERLHTKLDGMFAAGDVINKDLRQIITAASDGAIAATEAAHYIQNK